MSVLRGAAQMYDVGLTITKQGEANSANSSPDLASSVASMATLVRGVGKVSQFGRMSGSDDACWMMKYVQDRGGKAAYIGIGADTAAGHHSSRFDFDESAMPIALEVLRRTVKFVNR